MKKVNIKAIIAACMVALALCLASCNGNKAGKLTIDGKTYSVSLGDLEPTGHSEFKVLVKGKELSLKCQESVENPFWIGAIVDGKYYSATGKAILEHGLSFLIEKPLEQVDKIVVFSSNDKSFVEFDVKTKAVLPPSPTGELENLIASKNMELCEKFANYQPLPPEQNKAGVSFSIASNFFGMVNYSNDKVKKNQRFADSYSANFFAVDADNPAKELDLVLHSGHNMENTEFFGFMRFGKDVEAKYAFIGLWKIANAPEEYKMPTMFFVVELGDVVQQGSESFRAIKSFCETLYLAGEMFESLKNNNE